MNVILKALTHSGSQLKTAWFMAKAGYDYSRHYCGVRPSLIHAGALFIRYVLGGNK